MSRHLEYTVLDLAVEELDKAPNMYHKVQADICDSHLNIVDEYDFVFSRMLAEHILDAKQFHANIFKMLAPGGFAAHCFPTWYALPFIVNGLLPDTLANKILRIVAPRNAYRYGKFPAYYRWCRGPTKAQIQNFVGLGYEIIEYHAFFGHGEYYRRLPVLRTLHAIKTDFLLKHPNPYFSSYAYVLLRKPV